MKRNFILLILVFLLAPVLEASGEKSIYVPEFTATLRARYEHLFQENKGAFSVRNLRLGVNGYVAPILSYHANVDVSDWGKLHLIIANAKVAPLKNLSFSLGLCRLPFGLAVHRVPYQLYFSDRTFLARYAGVRDVGVMGSFSFPKFPLTAQASFFNCNGAATSKNFFTNSYGFSVKLSGNFSPNWYACISTARNKKEEARVQDWDIGAYFDNGLWHVEGEYLRRQFVHNAFKPVNACDFFVYRNFPIEKKIIGGVSGSIRYDYMGEHTTGIPSEEGELLADNPECHRLTAGATLTLKSKYLAAFRLNYEKYILPKGLLHSPENNDRIIFEIIAHF